MSRDEREPYASEGERLGIEFAARRGDPDRPTEEDYVARLATAADREAFREVVRNTEAAERWVPAPAIQRRVLSDRYRIEREIGAGGMGRVFAAYDTELEREVAIKVLAPTTLGDAGAEELLQKESRILARLKHPGIVAVHESRRDGDVFFVVMDLVDGVSAAEVLRRASSKDPAAKGSGAILTDAIDLPVADGRTDLVDPGSWATSIARIVLEVARTIEAAHQQDVVHRDIKPANVMLTGGGHPVVLDFGLSGQLGGATGAITEGLHGTTPYLAPEQLRARRSGTDKRTDVYQIGLLLYELLTLRRAFPDESFGAIVAKVQRGDFVPPRQLNAKIPRDLEAICLKAMELSPARRYPSALELRRDLERFVDGTEVPEAARGGALRVALRRLRLFVRRRPMTLVAVAAALAALMAAFVVSTLSGATWTKPALEAFRVHPTEQFVRLQSDAEVRVDDLLGVEVRGPSPSLVYALSVFRPRGPGDVAAERRRVKPMRPTLLDESVGSEAARHGRWDLAVAEGVQRVACTYLSKESATNEHEGLLVFAVDRPNPILEAWLSALDSAPGAELGVPFDDAVSYLTAIQSDPGSRGETVDRADEETRLEWRNLAPAIESGGDGWPIPGAWLSVQWRVRR